MITWSEPKKMDVINWQCAYAYGKDWHSSSCLNVAWVILWCCPSMTDTAGSKPVDNTCLSSDELAKKRAYGQSCDKYCSVHAFLRHTDWFDHNGYGKFFQLVVLLQSHFIYSGGGDQKILSIISRKRSRRTTWGSGMWCCKAENFTGFMRKKHT